MLTLVLPGVEVAVALVIPVENAGFARLKDGGDIRPFIALTVSQIDFHGDSAVEIEAHMGFGLVHRTAIIRPFHGKRRLDHRAINGDDIAKMFVFERQRSGGDTAQLMEDMRYLIQSTCVDRLVEGALLDAVRRCIGDGAGDTVSPGEIAAVPDRNGVLRDETGSMQSVVARTSVPTACFLASSTAVWPVTPSCMAARTAASKMVFANVMKKPSAFRNSFDDKDFCEMLALCEYWNVKRFLRNILFFLLLSQ